MKIEEGLPIKNDPRRVPEAVRSEQKEGVTWGPKAIISSGGRWGEKDVIVHYKNGNFMIEGKAVEKEEFIEALGPHLERMKKNDSVLEKLLGEN